MSLPASAQWLSVLRRLMSEEASIAAPRGMSVREILGFSSVVDMGYPVVMLPARKMSYRFMAAEAWWILSGRNDVESIARFNANITKFSDNGESFFGAYGPPLLEQRESVADALLIDRDSRQAVATIWRPRPPSTRDVPCTVALQWLIRGGKLHCVATMRSSDAWLGWVYDVFNFTMISLDLLLELRPVYDLRLGNLYLNAGSQHLYERDWEKAQKCLADTPLEYGRLEAGSNILLQRELLEFAEKNFGGITWPWLRVLAEQAYACSQQPGP